MSSENKSQQYLISWPAAALIAVFAFSPYLLTLNTPLLSDDWNVLKEIAQEGRGPIGHFIARFFHTEWEFYRPLFDGFCAFGYWMAGSNPAPYHLINMALHVVASIMVWRLALRVFRQSEHAGMLSFAVSILFAIHPRHSGAVGWSIGGLGDVQYTTCMLAGFLSHVRYIETKRTLFLVLGMLFLFLSLLAKESGVCLILFIPFASYLAYEKRDWNTRKAYIIFAGYIAVFVIYWLFRMNALGTLVGGYDPVEGTPLTPLRMITIYLTSVIAAFVGGNINLYPTLAWLVAHKPQAAGVGFILLIFGLFLIWRSRSKPLWVGLIIFTIAILPHIATNSFISLRDTAQERRMYLPLIGASFVFVSILWYGISCKSKTVFTFLCAALGAYFLWSLYQVNVTWNEAGQLTGRIIQQTIEVVKPVTKRPLLIGFLGLPDNYDGAYVFRTGLSGALEVHGVKDTEILQLAPISMNKGKPVPRMTFRRIGDRILASADRPVFKFSYSLQQKKYDWGPYVWGPVGTVEGDVARQGEVILEDKNIRRFLTFTPEGVRWLVFDEKGNGKAVPLQ